MMKAFGEVPGRWDGSLFLYCLFVEVDNNANFRPVFFYIFVETFLVLNYLLKLFRPKIVFKIFPISTGAVFF